MLDKSPRPSAVNVPNDLAAHWMPFTANRAFKKAPRLLAGAKDMHYFTVDGRKILDGASGMWCTNAGHGRSQISEAIAKQAATAVQAVDVVREQTGDLGGIARINDSGVRILHSARSLRKVAVGK